MSKSSSQRCELGHKTMPETNEKNRECARERETTTAFSLCLWLSDTMFASVSLLCSCVSTKPKQKQTTGTPVPHACKCGMRPCKRLKEIISSRLQDRQLCVWFSFILVTHTRTSTTAQTFSTTYEYVILKYHYILV